MKTNLIILLLLLGLASCTEQEKADSIPPSLYSQPKTVEANPEGGYVVNVVTGDTIKPLINSLGDTLITGVPIAVKGRLINPDSLSKPRVVKAKEPSRVINAHPNVHKIPDNLTIIPVNQDSLTVIPVEAIAEGDTSHYLINSLGDTIPTGVPIPAKEKVVKATQPTPTKALPLRFKDAANSNIQYLDVDQGMTSSYISSILEDKSGNLWFGTMHHGVSKYDGESFSHYTTTEGLSNNSVRFILEDKSGNLWFGTDGGVSKYDGESFSHFTEKEGLSSNWVSSILEDKSGNLWFGTWGGGVSKYDGETSNSCREGSCDHDMGVGDDLEKHKHATSQTFTHFTVKEGLSSNQVSSILEDKSGNLWFGTYDGGVSKYDGESFSHYTEKEGLSNNSVHSMLEDKSGNLWFGTGGGVSKYDGESFSHYTATEGLSSNILMSIIEDKSGNLWFGTFGGGVSKYDGETTNSCRENKCNHDLGVREDLEKHKHATSQSFSHFTTKEGLSHNIVKSIIEDKSGNLWFGTNGGVSKYDQVSFSLYTKKEGLSSNSLLSNLEDKSGNLWFGTDGGVSKYDGESFIHYTEKEGLSNNSVSSMLEDKSGNLWFGIYRVGVSKYDGKSFTHYTEKEGLSNKTVGTILEDKSGNLWFGTHSGGMIKYDGESFTHYTEKEGFLNNIVSSILEDKSGNLWFATEGGGVSRYDGSFFCHFTTKEGLSSNFVRCMLEDKSGNLWFGTDGGVSKYDGKSFSHYTEKEGLSINSVSSMLEDKSGNLWFGTGGGVSKYDGKSFTHYTEKEGLSSNFVRCMLEDKSGNLWFGTFGGLNKYDGESFSHYTEKEGFANNKKYPPKVHLRSLEINYATIDFRHISDSLTTSIRFDSVKKFENYPINLELAYDQNDLTFHFTAIDWSAPHKIQYSFRLLGQNDKWSNPSAERKAVFRDIDYGKYDFQIRAIGESGEWSEAFEYEFTINPPWWHTWWARIGYVLAAVLVIWGFVRWRTAKLKQRQKELEIEVDSATTEIRKQKAEVESQKDEIEKEKHKSDELLLNILPQEVADELKENGTTPAKHFNDVTVLFTDFVGFTSVSSKLTPTALVAEIHKNFSAFDNIIVEHGLEKIKTIGDAYMAVCGLPEEKADHAKMVINAALDIRDYIANSGSKFQIRIGVNSGPVVAGIVGLKKYAYDIWGDAVNIASRMESNSEAGRINISEATFQLLKDDPDFAFESRGKVEAKGKGEIEMYFVSKA